MITDLDSLTVQAIYKAYADAHDEDERTYLGASIIGDECERRLWYGFRWAVEAEKFDGRMLRLFQTGHREEARMIDDLRRAGIEVWDRDPDTDEQFGVSEVGGHFKGHADGVALGVREAPKTAHLLELKTHNAKNFAKLKNDGMRKSKPLHYAQMQIYMHLMSLSRGLYLAVCKDTDELYSERIEYDPVFAARLIGKAQAIITASEPPQKLHENPDSRMAWSCNYCPALRACHHSGWARRNCRTCLHSTPTLDGDGEWWCERHGHELTREDQRAGCAQHLYLPGLVPGEQTDASEKDGTVTYMLSDGRIWIDGGAENKVE